MKTTTTNDQLSLPLDFFQQAATTAEIETALTTAAAATADKGSTPLLDYETLEVEQPDSYKMLDLMGDFGYRLKGIFDCMSIAELEIADAKERYPEGKHAAIWDTFHMLQPSPILKMNTYLYSFHAYEIIQRVAEGEEKTIGQLTNAELLCMFSEASLASPLNQLGVRCYFELFREIYPDAVKKVWDYTPREDWPGQAQEEIERLKAKPSFKQKRSIRDDYDY